MDANSARPAVRTRTDGGVGHLLLDRPDAMNAITVELGDQLERGLRELAGDEAVRVIVIRGAGGNFSVGGDFNEVERLRASGPDALAPLFVNFGMACGAIADLPVPVVAAVEGYAMAGGFELMQACDIAVVRSDATIADNHANFGQVPGGGGSQRLPRLVGRQRALGHILSGDRLSGEQAAAWGLAYRCFEPDDFEQGVSELAEQLASKSRDALGTIKRLVYDGLRTSLEDGLATELSTVIEHVSGDPAGDDIAGFTGSKGVRT
ncbi:enoyl-CoA hydratase/isomerase family protein [Haloechinothrix salitolerans]|uniref:Enoyl-CoA hydratase/isomerase family protein n=1 Tax=Haloechinothrix salitolerans TaxID=926830 RepID=A0ABW2BT52_9PSEU